MSIIWILFLNWHNFGSIIQSHKTNVYLEFGEEVLCS